MKKLLPGLLISMLLWACTNESGIDIPDTEGIIKLSVSTKSSDKTSGIDLTQFTLILDGPTQKRVACPEDGIINGLTPGEYTVTLTNFEEEDYLPKFDDPRYSGTAETTVKGGKNTDVEMKLTQANAGIYFEYDPGLSESGYDNLIPKVKQNIAGADHTLVFENDTKDSKGYFAPGTVTVTVEQNGEQIDLEGEKEKVIELKAGKLWRIELVPAGMNGGISLRITVETVDEPTDEEEIILTPPSAVTGTLDYYGQVWNGPEAFAVLSLKNTTGGRESFESIIETYLYADNSSFKILEGRYDISPSLFNYELGSDNTVTHLYEKYGSDNSLERSIEVKGGYVLVAETSKGFKVDVYLDGVDKQSGAREEGYHIAFEGELSINNRALSFQYREIETIEAIYLDRGDGTADFINDFKYYVPNSEEGWESMTFRLNMLMPSCPVPETMPMQGTYTLSDSGTPPYIIPGNNDKNNPTGSFISAVMGTVYYDYSPVDGGTVIIEPNGKVHSTGAIGYDTKIIVTGAEPGTDIRVTEAFMSSSYIFIEDKTTGSDEQHDVTFTEAVCTYEWGMELLDFVEVGLHLKYTGDGEETSMSVELYMPWNNKAEEIVAGTYIASSNLEPYSYYPGSLDNSGNPERTYITSYLNDNMVVSGPLQQGPIKVTRDGSNYTIELEMTGFNICSNGAKMNINGSYEGVVTFVGFP